jgi:hypothetical protein
VLIRVGWKGSPGTNTLGYFAPKPVMKVEWFITMTLVVIFYFTDGVNKIS